MAKVKLKMQPKQVIMLKHNLNKNGKGQQFLTHEIRRLSDPYVPMDTGTLKNTAVEKINKIIYNQPYAKRMWYTHTGSKERYVKKSKRSKAHFRTIKTGKRGKMWCLRMWADRGDEIVKSVASYCGGRKG